MTQHHSDPTRENDTHALPNIEIWNDQIVEYDCDCGVYELPESSAFATSEVFCPSCEQEGNDKNLTKTGKSAYWYWFCFPGCLPDSEYFGPYETEEEALEAAREET